MMWADHSHHSLSALLKEAVPAIWSSLLGVAGHSESVTHSSGKGRLGAEVSARGEGNRGSSQGRLAMPFIFQKGCLEGIGRCY